MVINICQKKLHSLLHFYYNKTMVHFRKHCCPPVVVCACSTFLYLVVLWVFAPCFCIWLCCICSGFLFATRFCIWLCYEYLQRVFVFGCIVTREYLQHVSVFGCVMSICSVFLYLVVLWLVSICSTFMYLVVLYLQWVSVFATRFCIWLCCEYLQHMCYQTDVFVICWCFFYLHVFFSCSALSSLFHRILCYILKPQGLPET